MPAAGIYRRTASLYVHETTREVQVGTDEAGPDENELQYLCLPCRYSQQREKWGPIHWPGGSTHHTGTVVS